MMKKSLILLFCTIVVLLITSIGTMTQTKKADLKADLEAMMKFFEGEFDNYQQVFEEQEAKAQYPHEHIHSVFARVNLPAIGNHVFYVKQYMDGDPKKIYRQRLYNFKLTKQENAIELNIYTFPDEKAMTDAHLDQSKLAGLTLDKLQATPGCEVYWKRNGENFAGYMKDKACSVISKRSGKRIFITDNLTLTKDEIWINDQATDENGAYVFGNKSGESHKLRRVQRYTGYAAFKTDDDKDEAIRNLEIHNQGEMIPIANTKYTMQLAQLRYGGKTPVLVLKIFEKGNDKAIAYSWANADAEKIGINLRFVQTGLSLKK